MGSAYTSLFFHCVWCTQGRAPIFNESLRDIAFPFIRDEVALEGGRVIELGGTVDHVHILLVMKPSENLSRLMKIIKSKSTRFINENSSAIDFSWKTGYGAFTVSASKLEEVRRYIQNQEEFHKKVSSEKEYHALLNRHRQNASCKNPYLISAV